MKRRPSGRSEFRARLDQERRDRAGNQERGRDRGKDQLVSLRAVVNRAGDKGAEDGAPGIKKIHVAADCAEGFGVEEVAHRGPEDRYRCVERVCSKNANITPLRTIRTCGYVALFASSLSLAQNG